MVVEAVPQLFTENIGNNLRRARANDMARSLKLAECRYCTNGRVRSVRVSTPAHTDGRAPTNYDACGCAILPLFVFDFVLFPASISLLLAAEVLWELFANDALFRCVPFALSTNQTVAKRSILLA